MFQLEHVFLPVDFSRASRAAIDIARQLSDPAPRLEMIHVIEPWRPYVRDVFFPFAAMGEDAVDFEHELMERAVDSLQRLLELDRFEPEDFVTPLRAEMGERKEVLSEALAASGASLVVMGAFGEGGARPGGLGSTAARFVRAATRPVLLTRSTSQHEAKITRILCALDLTPKSSEVLRTAIGVALLCGAELEVVFVVPDPLVQDPSGLLRGHIQFDAEEVITRERPKIEALFERTYKNTEIPFPHQPAAEELWSRRKVLFGDPATTLVARADATDADLLVLGTSRLDNAGPAALGSVAWRVLRTTTSHTLVVPMTRQANLLDTED